MDSTVGFAAAFLAGILSFLSPCILPVIPAFFTILTGLSLEELSAGTGGERRLPILLHAVAFVLGFSVVFVLSLIHI